MYSYVSMYPCQSAGHRGCTLLPLWYAIAVVARYCRCGTLLPLALPGLALLGLALLGLALLVFFEHQKLL